MMYPLIGYGCAGAHHDFRIYSRNGERRHRISIRFEDTISEWKNTLINVSNYIFNWHLITRACVLSNDVRMRLRPPTSSPGRWPC